MTMFLVCATSIATAAQTLTQDGDKRWLVLSSHTEIERAVTVAKSYLDQFDHVRVVESVNGWGAVVAGPIQINGSVAATQEQIHQWADVPSDSYLSTGKRFRRTLWESGQNTFAPPPAPSSAAPETQTISSGTGFFVTDEGHLVTNGHVVSACDTVEVRLPGLTSEAASLLAIDNTNDLALLQVAYSPPARATFRTDSLLGEEVAVFGYPLSGFLSSGGNFTLGNITALRGLADDTRFVQISAPVQPGNSGGPVIDVHGNVVGVVTSKLDAIVALLEVGDVPQNVNFALRASTVTAFLRAYGFKPAETPMTDPLMPAELAKTIKSFSVQVVCH